MHPEALRIARHWLVTSLKGGRASVVPQDDIDWLQSLTAEAFEEMALSFRSYQPNPVKIASLPKEGGGFHDVPVPDRRDQLILTGLVVDEYATITRNVTCCQHPDIDYQNPLPQNPEDADWTGHRDGYHQFHDRAQVLGSQGRIILHTGVQTLGHSHRQFYLFEELRNIGWKPENIETLKTHMDAWESQELTGIPQGPAFSVILTKCLFNYIDHMMDTVPRIEYFRHGDDIYVAARSQKDMDSARSMLEVVLADAGLVLQENEADAHATLPGDPGRHLRHS